MMNRKSLLFVSILLVLVLLLTFAGCKKATPTPAPTVAPTATATKTATPTPTPKEVKPEFELKFNAQMSPTHSQQIIIDSWAQKIEKGTGGRVKITMYYSCALGPPTETYDSVVKRIADIAFTPVAYTPGRFPMSDALYLFQFEPQWKASSIYWQLYKEFPELQKEFADTKVLIMWSCVPQNVSSVKVPIRRIENLKGLKMYGSSEWAIPQIKALGAVPTILPFGDIYLSSQKGMLDGCMSCAAIYLKARSFYEVFKYHTLVSLNLVPQWIGMNWDTWKSLPPDIQKVFEECSGANAVEWMDVDQKAYELEAIEFAKNKGVEFIDLSPEETARWKAAVAPVKEDYIAYLEGKGLPGRKYVERFYELFDKYKVK